MKTIIPGNKWSFSTLVEKHENDKGIRIQDKQPEISEFMAELRETHSELEHTYAVINRLKVTFVKV